MNYAQIEDGIVVNVLSIDPEQEGEFPDCVQVPDILISIGDTYENGKFYHNGVELKTAYAMLDEANEILAILGGETV